MNYITCFNVSVFTYTLNAIYTENEIIAIANEIFNDCIILEKSTCCFQLKIHLKQIWILLKLFFFLQEKGKLVYLWDFI